MTIAGEIARIPCPPMLEFDTSSKMIDIQDEIKMSYFFDVKLIFSVKDLHTKYVRRMPVGFGIHLITDLGRITRRVLTYKILR